MCRSCWCANPADPPILLTNWSCWFPDLADAPVPLMRWSYWCADPADFAYAPNLLMYWSTDAAADALMILSQDQELLVDLSIAICSSFLSWIIQWFLIQDYSVSETTLERIFLGSTRSEERTEMWRRRQRSLLSCVLGGTLFKCTKPFWLFYFALCSV